MMSAVILRHQRRSFHALGTPAVRNQFQRLVEEARKTVGETTPVATVELAKTNPKTVIIDTREQDEWKTQRAAHPNVVHLSKGVLERDVEKIVPSFDTPIVVYCAGGFRSLLAAESLKRMGFTSVKSMAGGLGGWANAGLPMDRSPK